MTTSELFAQDEDVTDAKMQKQKTKKTKRPDGSDGEKEKKKMKKNEEHKTRKDKQKEELESETEPCVNKEEIKSETDACVKKDKEMKMQKKKKAKLSEVIDENNRKRGLDSDQVKKKKKQNTEDSSECSLSICKEKKKKKQKIEDSSECSLPTPELFAQDEDVTDAKMQKTKKTKQPDGSDGEKKKKKKKKKKKEEHKTRKDKQKEELESETEPCVNKEEIESETDACVKNDKEMKMQKKKKATEVIDENNRKRGLDSDQVKKKKKQNTEDSSECSLSICKEKKKKKQKIEDSSESSLPINKEKKRKKKTKSVEGGSQEKVHEGGAGLRENKDIGSPSERPSPKGSSKKVRFAENVEIFPLVDGPQSSGKTKQDDGLIRGKRFSKEEDEMVKKAVFEYIELHRLGDEGLKMVLHCKAFPEVKNCWKDIGKTLPWRPHSSVYYRAHILFERDESRKWTREEYEIVRKFHDKHGADWKGLADALGKHRFHVKDTWRRIKLPNMKKGQWSQDEYQNLFDLVNIDLRLKVSEEKKSKYGMLRDNICWGAISDSLTTRSTALCCQKWYSQLTSPMVASEEWADVDDYRLVDALSSLDACSIEDVEWEQLLEHRNGEVCRKRWSQMVKHIGDNGNKPFSDQVEVLAKRYSLDVLGARETYDNAPIVD